MSYMSYAFVKSGLRPSKWLISLAITMMVIAAIVLAQNPL
jgi:hypothetical protein